MSPTAQHSYNKTNRMTSNPAHDDAPLILRDMHAETLGSSKPAHLSGALRHAVEIYHTLPVHRVVITDVHPTGPRNARRLIILGSHQFELLVTRRRHPQRAAQQVHRVIDAALCSGTPGGQQADLRPALQPLGLDVQGGEAERELCSAALPAEHPANCNRSTW